MCKGRFPAEKPGGRISTNEMKTRITAGGGRNNAGLRGFTLVEVMVASMIGAIVFAALFFGVTQGYAVVQKQREALRAEQILVGKVEGIRLCAWDTNPTNSTYQLFNPAMVSMNFTDSFYPVGLSGTTNDGVIYSGTIQILTNNLVFYGSNLDTNGLPVASTAPSYSNQMAQAVVTVTWQDIHGGRTNTLLRSMKTYIAQYGIQNYIFTH